MSDKNLRISFLVNALIVTLVLVAPIPFFSQISKEIPLISLLLGEVSLIFLVVLASFPKAGIKDIIRIGSQYLIFIGLCFASLSFMPFDSKFKLFSFASFEAGIPNLVSVNLIGLIILNTIACLLFGIELNRKQTVRRFKNKEEREMAKISEMEAQQKRNELSSELKQDVNSLFDLYLKDYADDKIESNEKLENIESALLNNIDIDISGAMCVDKDGNMLHDSVFHWNGHRKESLIEVFKKHNEESKKLGTGMLCQMLFQDKNHWYVIAKFRGNYLILQTEQNLPGPLLETSFKVFKSLQLP